MMPYASMCSLWCLSFLFDQPNIKGFMTMSVFFWNSIRESSHNSSKLERKTVGFFYCFGFFFLNAVYYLLLTLSMESSLFSLFVFLRLAVMVLVKWRMWFFGLGIKGYSLWFLFYLCHIWSIYTLLLWTFTTFSYLSEKICVGCCFRHFFYIVWIPAYSI